MATNLKRLKKYLKDGWVICNRCKGEGLTSLTHYNNCRWLCSKCKGHGAVDWITNIMGTK